MGKAGSAAAICSLPAPMVRWGAEIGESPKAWGGKPGIQSAKEETLSNMAEGDGVTPSCPLTITHAR